jgi:2-succinyl-5-enolpyruvyl-6-hydroxy-3-cyclohexene-1-carboxylate synthase
VKHIETLTRYTANFVDELTKNGLTNVVISPGSRSTPLALTFTEHPDIKEWVIIDERSAAFFALGIAKQTKQPVALVCTSGTAAANYFPAIVEAYHSRVPLIVLTADRPHELRDVGAPQAIEQIKLYGDYVKWFQEMALPEGSPTMLQYVRNKAARAFYMAHEGNPGPVHLNFPFREPLNPDFSLEHLWGGSSKKSGASIYNGRKHLDQEQLQSLFVQLQHKQKGVIVCGPQVESAFAEAVVELASAWNLPILADPLSQIRSGKHTKKHIIEGYDAFLRSETIRKRLKPDFIIRFGAMPVSKPYLFYVKENKQAVQFIVENHTGFREPTGNVTEFIFADPVLLCEDLVALTGKANKEKVWLEKWLQMNEIAKKHLDSGLVEEQITEGEAVRGLIEVLPEQSSLYVGNSMAIRDVDTFFMTTEKEMTVLANRGANGIDGMISSGMGAAATGKPVTLLLGDLSFYHDLNGLLAAKHYGLNITILLINNNGGGIFSFLSQAADKKHFDSLFGTPLDIDFKHVITMYDGQYTVANNVTELKRMLKDSANHQGLSVIEVKTDRDDNVDWHKKKWQAIEQEILMRKE